jgi:hypothetical protein
MIPIVILLLALGTMQLTRSGVLVATRTESVVVREGDLLVPNDGKPQPGDSRPYTNAVCVYWTGLGTRAVPLQTIPMSDTRASDCPYFLVGS